MSTSVYWSPVTVKRRGGFGQPIKGYLLNAWPGLEHGAVQLDRTAGPVLHGMLAASNSAEARRNLHELISALESCGSIELEIRE